MLTKQKMIELKDGTIIRAKDAPTDLNVYMQIILEGLYHARDNKDAHCATVARLYHDQQVTTAERDLLLLYIQARSSADPASVKREYVKCMEDYQELLNPKPEEKEG